jgi:hypothetical protein
METSNNRRNEGAQIKPATTQICPLQTTHRETGLQIRVLLIEAISKVPVLPS